MRLRSERFERIGNAVRCAPLFLLAMTAVNVPLAGGPPGGLSAADRRSLGEIRYLFTPQERKELGRLSGQEKMAYAERLLRERSPECKRWHKEHVAWADKLFSTSGFRGSMTDAGRFFLVWGPPQKVHRERIEDSYWAPSREEFIPFKYTRMTWIYTTGMGLRAGEKRVVVFTDMHLPRFFELKSDEIISEDSTAKLTPEEEP